MSKITLKELNLENHTKSIKKFCKKLEELSVIEKELNIEGFQVVISSITKKD
jgi:hypothetical protein